ncbi:50S ribosomal protein L21 [Asticcacaulis sp. AND118]|uniref:50S ribosomal protein L21 n=1 Tax=Asticcacaulis sp. AND118 TaxID=2840468 RepID=UPI001CFFFA1D|nr:50S ribosomal protein L21 [Asticcacaulis sp. AND118]UDF03765.1 50S ribosomal protein L21 [Asticcacaulis sp. AND118]
MYAVIKTGGKQYRVAAGDLLVVEKLEGDAGAAIRFEDVLLVGDEAGAVVGAPLVDGAVVEGTLIETRKGKKVKIFKKIRRQGYRRTNGHRQPESVIRITALNGAGKSAAWEGTVSLVTKAELDARARGLAPKVQAQSLAEAVEAPVVAEEAAAPKKKPAPKKKAAEASSEEA